MIYAIASIENKTTGFISISNNYRPIQFSILLILLIFSIPCFIFTLYHYLSSPTLYRALSNHVVIFLLISNGLQSIMDIPLFLPYIYTGTRWPPSTIFCSFIFFIDYYLFTVCFLLLSWASIERHILVFHMNLYSTKLRRVIGHYFPLGLCFIYPLIYYIYFIYLYPCKNFYDENLQDCTLPCYLRVSDIVALYEQIGHGFALMLIIFVFNLCLIIRVIQHKRRINQQQLWKKNWKMAAQLLSICILYFVTNTGYFVIQIGRLVHNADFGTEASIWICPLSLCMPLLMSFFCMSSLPGLKQKLRKFIYPKQRSIIVPIQSAPA